MQSTYTKKMLMEEFGKARRVIMQANRGLPYPVKIDTNYALILHDGMITMQIKYLDGDYKPQIFNIAL